MKPRNCILFGILQYLAMAAGILGATRGREKLLAGVIPLALVVPMWIYGYRKLFPRNPGQVAGGGTAMKPQTGLIIWIILLCSSIWTGTHYYQRADWVGVVVNSLLVVAYLVVVWDYARRLWGKPKGSESRGGVA